jgi:CRP-like cAMP-binding protein
MTMSQRRRTPVDPELVDSAACTVDLRHQILHGVPFFRQLTHAEVSDINAAFRARDYQPGQAVYAAGDPAEHLFVIATGKVKLVRHTLGGQNVLLDILSAGDLFGSLAVLGDDTYPDTAQAQTACCVLDIGASDFRAVLQGHPSAALGALDFVAARLRDAHETVSQLSSATAEARIAAVLLKLAQKLGVERHDAILIQMPLSRQDIAEMTATTVETASRVMSQFRKDGLIESGRQWVSLTNPDGLAEVAEIDQG